jgi:hypothetical protein
VTLNFDSPEWETASGAMRERLIALAQMIDDERYLASLVMIYRHQSSVSVSIGAVEDRLLHEVRLDQQAALPLIVDALNRQIAAKRQAIERLLSEVAG